MKIVSKYLKKVYDKGAYGLRDANVDIESGEFAVIVGESGSGKSTLLRLIAGLDKPTAGELYLDGLLADSIPAKDRNISMVFQEYVLYPKFTVWENIAVALERYHLTREEEDLRIRKILKTFDLVDVAGQLPKVLSGGQQQRVALARAVVTKPKAILFDEPLSNIAEKQRINYITYIKELKKQLPNVTFVYVTHNLMEAFMLADKLIVMSDGRILQQGKRNFVMENPYSEEVLFTLSPEAERSNYGIYNIFTDTVQAFDSNGAIGLQPQTLFLKGSYDGCILRFLEFTEAMDDNFNYRFIGDCGNILVGIPTERIHWQAVVGDIKIPAERVSEKELRLSDGSMLYMYDTVGFDGYIAFAKNSIELYSLDGNRLTAHYRVYTNYCNAFIHKRSIALPCGKIYHGGIDASGKASVTFGKGVYAVPSKKKGIKVKRCLDEEIFGDKKLCYCYLKGFDRYVAIYVKADNPYIQNTRLDIDVSTVDIYKK